MGEGVYILLNRPPDTLDLWFVEHCINLPNVFDLEQRCDKHDKCPACHRARITFLVIVGVALTIIVHLYTTRRLRKFADSLHAHRR